MPDVAVAPTPAAPVFAAPVSRPVANYSASQAMPSANQSSPSRHGDSAGEMVLGVVGLGIDLIGGAWRLILGIGVILFVVFLIRSCVTSATLNEHSSCGDFAQASADDQNRVLQDMRAAHHDTSSIQTTRVSLNLYCTLSMVTVRQLTAFTAMAVTVP